MASEDAKNVAKQVLETLGSGEKVILGEILRNNGYAETTSLTPQFVTETKSYKSVVEPVVKKMERERDRLMKSIETKDLDAVTYKDSVSSVDTLTKNIQLLSGKETERTSIVMEDSDKISNAIRNITTGDNRGSDTEGN